MLPHSVGVVSDGGHTSVVKLDRDDVDPRWSIFPAVGGAEVPEDPGECPTLALVHAEFRWTSAVLRGLCAAGLDLDQDNGPAVGGLAEQVGLAHRYAQVASEHSEAAFPQVHAGGLFAAVSHRPPVEGRGCPLWRGGAEERPSPPEDATKSREHDTPIQSICGWRRQRDGVGGAWTRPSLIRRASSGTKMRSPAISSRRAAMCSMSVLLPRSKISRKNRSPSLRSRR